MNFIKSAALLTVIIIAIGFGTGFDYFIEWVVS